jgi:hypothetical protein
VFLKAFLMFLKEVDNGFEGEANDFGSLKPLFAGLY